MRVWLQQWFSLCMALVLLGGSAWIGHWRTQRAVDNRTDSDPATEESLELAGASNNANAEAIDTTDDDDGEPESVAEAVAANAEARDRVDLEGDVRQVRTALKRKGQFDAEALSALSTLLREGSSPPSPELVAARDELINEFLDIARARLPQELLPPALQLSAWLKQRPTASKEGAEFIALVDAAKLREEQLATAERALGSTTLSASRFQRAAEALAYVLEQEPGHARALNLRTRLEERQISAMRAFAEQLEFARAEQALASAQLLATGSSVVQSAADELRARRASAEGSTLNAFDTALQANEIEAAESALALLGRLGYSDERMASLKLRVRNQRTYGGFQPGESFSDALANGQGNGPVLRVLPAGRFVMGSSNSEEGHRTTEAPARSLRFTGGLAMAQNEITVGEFRVFVQATGHRTDAERIGWSASYQERSGRFVKARNVTWQDNFMGDAAKDKQPVLHVSFNDASAYALWLSTQTGKRYRLPSEAEFEYAARAGTSTPYWWGSGTPPEKLENLTGERDQSRTKRRWTVFFAGYGDGFWGPAPVRSFKANPFGLFDMSGNLAEWTEDCWHDSYTRAPNSLRAWVNPGCELRVVRGASWGTSPSEARSASRQGVLAESRSARVGFRVVREL